MVKKFMQEEYCPKEIESDCQRIWSETKAFEVEEGRKTKALKVWENQKKRRLEVKQQNEHMNSGEGIET